MSILSKYVTTVPVPCTEYVHPWTQSCANASADLFLRSIPPSFRLYVTAYVLALLMRGRIPSRKDLKQTILGILQSTAFLACHAFGYSVALCSLRRLFGEFNFISVSFLPSFLSSLCAILVERPSRRGLLSLYVTNVASETLFHMAVWRGWLKPIKYGEVLIFCIFVSMLLFFYRGTHNTKDSIYSLLRFIVGPCEEQGYVKKELSESEMKNVSVDIFPELCSYVQNFGTSPCCPHNYSCAYYCLKSGLKLFAIGYGLNLSVKLLLQLKRILVRPKLIFSYAFKLETMRLGAFFGSFGTLFRAVSCILRYIGGEDSQLNAVPAGAIAGLSFFFYRDNTVALYFMWKALQIMYAVGADRQLVPHFPHASIFFHAFATAILFHAALLEPHNVRPSYWRFLMSISGGRVGQMDRKCLDHFGLQSSKSLEMAQSKLKRH